MQAALELLTDSAESVFEETPRGLVACTKVRVLLYNTRAHCVDLELLGFGASRGVGWQRKLWDQGHDLESINAREQQLKGMKAQQGGGGGGGGGG